MAWPGGGGKAIVAGQLKKELFAAFLKNLIKGDMVRAMKSLKELTHPPPRARYIRKVSQ